MAKPSIVAGLPLRHAATAGRNYFGMSRFIGRSLGSERRTL
jgi:hypothetical protein